MTYAEQFRAVSAIFTREEMQQNIAGHTAQARKAICEKWSRRNIGGPNGRWLRKEIRDEVKTLRTAMDMTAWLDAQALA